MSDHPDRIQIPAKLAPFLREQCRYKLAYGGRGAAKSRTIATILLAFAQSKKLRILCTRELQNSIRDSVHRLLKDMISYYGWDGKFHVTEQEIRCIDTGSEFIFKGLRSNTAEIKSLQGIHYCWIEEAQSVTEQSLDLLTPTIREPGSEIWMTFNTGSKSDPVYQRFVTQKRDDSFVAFVNYWDNPWFGDPMKSEMQEDQKKDPDKYLHKWCGEPAQEGRFYTSFGKHLAEEPFEIPQSLLRGRLFGSLDHGIGHPTVFCLWYVSDYDYGAGVGPDSTLHCLFTYSARGGTTADHARAIYNRISSFSWTHGLFPEQVFADSSMFTSQKYSEQLQRSHINEYMDAFAGTVTQFTKATRDKEGRCQLSQCVFAGKDGFPAFRYWRPYNATLVEGLMRVEVDPNNIEEYRKQDGDDEADCCGYGIHGIHHVVMTASQAHAMVAEMESISHERESQNWMDY